MSLLVAAFVVEIAFVIAAPLGLAAWLRARGFGTWKLFLAGALSFVGSQIVHIPLLLGVTALGKLPGAPHPSEAWKLAVNAVILGLAAGACEEPARWLVLRHVVKTARGWKAAVMLGTGHGGAESVLVGVSVALSLVAMLLLRVLGPARLGVHANQLSVVDDVVRKFWSTAPAMPLVGAGERVLAFAIHLAASVLVMRGVVEGRARWLALAILFHAAVDAVAVYVQGRWGAMVVELVMVGFAALAAVVVRVSRDRGAPPRPELA